VSWVQIPSGLIKILVEISKIFLYVCLVSVLKRIVLKIINLLDLCFCFGERGIRTLGMGLPYDALAMRYLRPLGHLSFIYQKSSLAVKKRKSRFILFFIYFFFVKKKNIKKNKIEFLKKLSKKLKFKHSLVF
jgi:hypothetical protein